MLGDMAAETPLKTTGNGSAAAAAPAYDVSSYRPPEENFSDMALPVLPAEPNEEELLAYAAAHPTVRRAISIFRGKIVNVEAGGAPPNLGTR
jgi:hypothetical protein